MLGSHWCNWCKQLTKQGLALGLAIVLALGLVSCNDRSTLAFPPSIPQKPSVRLVGRLSEAPPPRAIQELRQTLDAYQPQVAIVSPKADQVIQDTEVAVQFQVRDLPLFQDDTLGLGPHLHVILDNQSYQAVYDTRQPLVLKDLAPGTHTLRVFASRPWHESFKNEGAYAQVTFHVFTQSPDNHPDPKQPLLTYSRPKGSYGAEPILLDFYLTNAPLHLVAQQDPEDAIPDWRIRCTINGESFILDDWQPVYLKGFKRGANWVKLEFLDDQGNPVTNAFNTTVQLIDYQPGGKDTLSRLVRGDLSAKQAIAIVERAAIPEPEPEPEPEAQPSLPEPEEAIVPSPVDSDSPLPNPASATEERVPSTPALPQETPRTESEANLVPEQAPEPGKPEAIPSPSPSLPIAPEPIEGSAATNPPDRTARPTPSPEASLEPEPVVRSIASPSPSPKPQVPQVAPETLETTEESSPVVASPVSPRDEEANGEIEETSEVVRESPQGAVVSEPPTPAAAPTEVKSDRFSLKGLKGFSVKNWVDRARNWLPERS